MSDTATTTAPMQRVTLRLGQIRVNENNVRRDLDLNERFLKSIAANGVKVPVVVLPLDEDAYELKMGHRRFRRPGRQGDGGGEGRDRGSRVRARPFPPGGR
ncbi:ParB N-terminal domain-containing protein [Streptomyces phaeochromogenes]|nr:ParB N-terminal domain-containing protein [Streptomyces phaeochromogenes]